MNRIRHLVPSSADAQSGFATTSRFLSRLAIGLLFTSLAGSLVGDELHLDAESLFARSVSGQLRLHQDRSAIELQQGVLLEDDGPAAGFSYQPNVEPLLEGVWIRKQLIVSDPRASQATLLVGGRGEVSASINGKPTPLRSAGKQGNYWQAYHFPPERLRRGSNEFVLSGRGTIWIARDDEYAQGSRTRPRHPNRSARSRDGGKSWNDTRLGEGDNVDGEYYVRLFLDQYQPQGSLTLDVIDVGNLAEKPIGSPVDKIGPIEIQTEATQPAGTTVTMRARTGRSLVPDKHWSDWSPVALASGVIAEPAERYLQLELRLATDDPQVSPALTGLTISASPQRPADWTSDLSVGRVEAPPTARSSIPFAYEPFDRPELAELRRKYELDKLVAGTSTEFETVQRLAAWTATRWQKMHLKDSYPPYNGLEILKPHADGTPIGGFCQQYNVLFLQACQSFGLVGRLVSLGPGNMTDKIRGGHEAVEIWSNEFHKWIYIDGNTAWYAVDAKTNIPLSLWELRRRQLAAFQEETYPPIKVITLAKTKHEWPSLKHWPPFIELRLIPRNNFLQEQTPLPLNQGMRGWFWTGHYVWDDEKQPARPLYSHRIAKRANFEWTLNQTQLAFEATQPGTLRVHAATDTPGFQTFLRQTNKQLLPVDPIFDWKLAPGTNELTVVSQNSAGRNGPATKVELKWSPPGK